MRIAGYHVDEAICTSAAHVIHRGRRAQDGQSVLIKVIPEASADPAAQAQLAWEYEITHNLALEGVVPTKELVPNGAATALILEDVGGVPTLMTLTSSAGVGVRASDGQLMWRYEQAANRTANATPGR